ncbi:MAG: 23S rRNA (uracil(1939)-C(5))-methyltransferase RlmD [Firmicutes bacterium]|nr:23S rRNA (uracil(1939)-C(5))-methyltransferase RlmD [Bacillota bacterium]
MEAALRVGQQVELKIDGYGHDGEGVGRFRNFTVFVPDLLQGEQALVKITEVKKNFARGVVRKITRTAPERIKPVCPVARDCGGCQLQHIKYEAQLLIKRQRVIDAVERIGGLKEVTVHPVLGMAHPWHYRNKAQYPVGIENIAVVIGFYKKGTHQIVPVKECLLQPPLVNRLTLKIRELVEKSHIAIYDEQTGAGLLRHVLLRYGFHTGEMMVVFVTNGAKFLAGEKLARELAMLYPEIKSVVQNINESRDNVILGAETKVLWGKETIVDRIGKLKFKISAQSFFQVNPAQTEVLYQKAVEYAGLTGQETVLDAYSGVGSLSLFLAQNAKKVYGIEVVAEAVKNANESAAFNEIYNAQFLLGTVEKVLPQLVKGGTEFQAAVVDPPRSGCEETVFKAMAASKIRRIVYVSCNPGTMARDLKVIEGLGYKTVEIQPVDMFPQTYHIECVARIEKK